MIWSSAFIYKFYNKNNGVSICVDTPGWAGFNYHELAPTDKIREWWENLTYEQRQEEKYKSIYTRLYLRDVLSKLDPKKVAKDLEGKVILSHEPATVFSHRAIVRCWLNYNLGKGTCREVLNEFEVGGLFNE